MKKSKLIEMLNQVSDDAEIKLWNGFVCDWVDLKTELVPVMLFKMTESYYIEVVRQERAIYNKDWDYKLSIEEVANLKKLYKKVCKWEEHQFVIDDDVHEGRYKAKVVYMLQAKTKGVTTWDRGGDISY